MESYNLREGLKISHLSKIPTSGYLPVIVTKPPSKTIEGVAEAVGSQEMQAKCHPVCCTLARN
jgi:hypothetical protein